MGRDTGPERRILLRSIIFLFRAPARAVGRGGFSFFRGNEPVKTPREAVTLTSVAWLYRTVFARQLQFRSAFSPGLLDRWSRLYTQVCTPLRVPNGRLPTVATRAESTHTHTSATRVLPRAAAATSNQQPATSNRAASDAPRNVGRPRDNRWREPTGCLRAGQADERVEDVRVAVDHFVDLTHTGRGKGG